MRPRGPWAGCVALLLAGLPAGARAEAGLYRVGSAQGEGDPSPVALELPYSLGTHRLRVTRIQGAIRLDPSTLQVTEGTLRFPVEAIRSGDATLECHLQEALGIDYARSRFPADHVCDDDRLPATGPDAVAFPEIVLTLVGSAPLGGTPPVEGGHASEVEAWGTLAIHGVTRPIRLRLTVSAGTEASRTVRVRGRHVLRLADFGVEVKPTKFLFVKISVGDEVTVLVDLPLVPSGGL